MIGGGVTARIQVSRYASNRIGEQIQEWDTVQEIPGWLDLSAGTSEYQTYYAKVQESTHVFIADYRPLDSRVSSGSGRMLINGKVYDILLIDNPMELNQQWEIYLKLIGGQ